MTTNKYFAQAYFNEGLMSVVILTMSPIQDQVTNYDYIDTLHSKNTAKYSRFMKLS